MSTTDPHPRRRQRAAQTRRDVLHAARTLFVANGYTATTVSDIAAEAGVALQTVYSSVGTKAQLLVALVDLIRDDAGIRGIDVVAPEFEGPWDVLASGPRARRAIVEAGGDVIRLLADNAANEPDVGRAWDALLLRAHAGVQAAMGLLADHGVLRPGLEIEEAADRASAIMHPVAILHLMDRGWTLPRIEAALLDTLARTLTTLEGPN
jgi:AcrR family transcriptional regulator